MIFQNSKNGDVPQRYTLYQLYRMIIMPATLKSA